MKQINLYRRKIQNTADMWAHCTQFSIGAWWKGMWAKLGSILTGIETLAPVGRPSIFSHNPLPATRPPSPAASAAREKSSDKRPEVDLRRKIGWREGRANTDRSWSSPFGAGESEQWLLGRESSVNTPRRLHIHPSEWDAPWGGERRTRLKGKWWKSHTRGQLMLLAGGWFSFQAKLLRGGKKTNTFPFSRGSLIWNQQSIEMGLLSFRAPPLFGSLRLRLSKHTHTYCFFLVFECVSPPPPAPGSLRSGAMCSKASEGGG